MAWHEKNHPTPFDAAPPQGVYFLDGDLLSRRYTQEWIQGKKYPVVSYPSGLMRELTDSPENGVIINIFGAFDLPTHTTRDQGFERASEFAVECGYSVARRGNNELLVFHPHTAHGYAIVYDSRVNHIANIKRVPEHAMDLLDAESRAVLPPLYANEKLGLDALAPVKFFTPDNQWTWYATEYDGKDTFFGLVSGFEVEMGYFSMVELEGVRGSLGLPIERDLYFTPTPLRQLKAQHEE
jgi:Protein of unknown function (DUF2958)